MCIQYGKTRTVLSTSTTTLLVNKHSDDSCIRQALAARPEWREAGKLRIGTTRVSTEVGRCRKWVAFIYPKISKCRVRASRVTTTKTWYGWLITWFIFNNQTNRLINTIEILFIAFLFNFIIPLRIVRSLQKYRSMFFWYKRS